MRPENFIYFSVVSGFFIGVIFSILRDLGVEGFIINVLLITLIFYLIALGSVAFYLKFIDIRKKVLINKEEIDKVLDNQIKELEEKEDFILKSFEFIKQIEQEELAFLRKNKK